MRSDVLRYDFSVGCQPIRDSTCSPHEAKSFQQYLLPGVQFVKHIFGQATNQEVEHALKERRLMRI